MPTLLQAIPTVLLFALLIATIVFVIKGEIIDKKLLIDKPDCSYMQDYCMDYNQARGVNLLVRELPEGMTIKDLIEFSRSKLNSTYLLVFWRIAFFSGVLIALIFGAYFWLAYGTIRLQDLLMIIIVSTLIGYASKYYMSFHYYRHYHHQVRVALDQIEQKLEQEEK